MRARSEMGVFRVMQGCGGDYQAFLATDWWLGRMWPRVSEQHHHFYPTTITTIGAAWSWQVLGECIFRLRFILSSLIVSLGILLVLIALLSHLNAFQPPHPEATEIGIKRIYPPNNKRNSALKPISSIETAVTPCSNSSPSPFELKTSP